MGGARNAWESSAGDSAGERSAYVSSRRQASRRFARGILSSRDNYESAGCPTSSRQQLERLCGAGLAAGFF